MNISWWCLDCRVQQADESQMCGNIFDTREKDDEMAGIGISGTWRVTSCRMIEAFL